MMQQYQNITYSNIAIHLLAIKQKQFAMIEFQTKKGTNN